MELPCPITMAGVADVQNFQGLRLRNAAAAAFAALNDYGFRVRGAHTDAWRGVGVVVATDTVEIAVDADWYDRELCVSIQVAGAGPIPVENVIPELAGAVRLLPHNATRGVLQRRLELIVRTLRRKRQRCLRAVNRHSRGCYEPVHDGCEPVAASSQRHAHHGSRRPGRGFRATARLAADEDDSCKSFG